MRRMVTREELDDSLPHCEICGKTLRPGDWELCVDEEKDVWWCRDCTREHMKEVKIDWDLLSWIKS